MGEVLKPQNKLIFDIGAHKGDDTAVYLQLGYKVVAVEANPILKAEMEKRFSEAISSTQLTFLNYAIAKENNKEIFFFLSSDDSQSSLLKQSKHSVKVISRTLESLILEFGVPFFCKIDIEGCDYMAVQSLSKTNCPPFISVEISGDTLTQLATNLENIFVNLNILKALGYTKFKLVDQETLTILRNSSFYKANLKFMKRVSRKILSLFSIDKRSRFLKKYKLGKDAEVSGLPGYLLKEEWLTYDEIKRRIEFHFYEYYSVASSKELIFWVDLHAAL